MADESCSTRSPTGSRRSPSTTPRQRNALSGQLLAELVEAMKRARGRRGRPGGRAHRRRREGLLRRRRPRRLRAPTRRSSHKHFASDLFLEFFRLMPRLGKPSLCAANGHVLAGGMGLALSCDLIIAKEGATLRHARDQRRRLPVHDHGAHLPQRPAQEGQRDDAAGRAAHGRGGGRVRARQQGRPGRGVRRGGRRVGRASSPRRARC